MSFLDALSSAMLGQVGLVENLPGNLDESGVSYGRLGDFANQIDKSAQRSYVESGTINNIKPRTLEIISQEPDLTVVIKKRLFSSLAENYRAELMDDDEKLFIRASKQLFYNKCKAIAAYERLTKFERIVSKSNGVISDYGLPLVFDAVDSLTALTGSSVINSKTRAVLETVRKVKKFSDPQFFTTWNIANDIPYASDMGPGTGTFDLTMVSQFSVTNTVNLAGGHASLTVEDPYKLMIISNSDIERAISEASSLFKQRNFFTLTESQLTQSIIDLKDQLNEMRLLRGVSRIFFKQQDNSILNKNIRAFIDEEGREISFTFSAGSFGVDLFSFDSNTVDIDPSATEGQNGLTESDSEIFKQIVHNMYVLVGLQNTTQSNAVEYNKLTNPIRKKMQLHYGNQPIIQPMDEVTIFLSSKTVKDSMLNKGFNINFGNSPANLLNDTIGNIESSLDDLKATFGAGSGTSSVEQEKNAIVGPDFPLWLWNMLRNDFLRQSAGTCVFSGLIDNSSHSYSNGKYALSVSANDKSAYLKMGQININPSTHNYNGALNDPLTPFKLDFAESNGLLLGEVPPLLDANIRLLNSGSIRSKNGRFRGLSMDEAKYNVKDEELTAAGKFRRKLYSPDGFIYRWKEGIGSLVAFGEPHSSLPNSFGTYRSERSVSITQDPLAGQDVMNVLSLLITGKPYNFNNFVRGALDWAKLSRNDLLNEDVSVSFFKGLINDLSKQNSIWGNFIPFKQLNINERGYDFLAKGEFDLTVRNSRLSALLNERAKKYDEIVKLAPFAVTPSMFYKQGTGGGFDKIDDPISRQGLNTLTNELKLLDGQINDLQKNFFKGIDKKLQNDEGTLGIFGDDISFDPSVTGMDGQTNETKRLKERSELRKKINYLTQRRIWAVRGNEDANLFIVDDAYDKNYDIQAFEKALSSQLKLFDSTYSNVFEKVQMVGNILGLEVFANSQGHIEARPPQYNRMPSSVYRNLLRKRVEKGIQIFPSYLENLFFTNVQGLIQQIEIIEDNIRLRAAAIGRTEDGDVEKLLSSQVVPEAFKFLTNSEGNFNEDIRRLLDQAHPDLQEDRNKGAIDSLSTNIKKPFNAKVSFDIVKRIEVINQEESFKGSNNDAASKIKEISDRLKFKTRDNIPSNLQAVLGNDRISNRINQADVLNITNQIAQYVSERQRLIKTLSNSIKNLQQGVLVNDTSSSTAQSVLMPNITSDKNEYPEIIEHMIEDEEFDDLGPNSGQRYILTDDKIKSLQINIKAPDYNVVQVDGRLASGLVEQPSGLNVGNGGNAMGTAWAVDYDMWRLYGYRAAQPVNAPYFSNPVTQCAPYAVFLLNLARKRVFTGTATVIGCEYMQPGEVSYIDDRDLLFYNDSVTHNFTMGSDFSTSLNLTYGHNPGEYIPTQLDIIGKGLYTNRHQADLVRHVRHGRSDDSNHITVITKDSNSATFTGQFNNVKALVEGDYGEQNRKNLGNLMLTAGGLLNTGTFGKVLNIELRIYKNSDPKIGLSENKGLKSVAESVKAWLLNPSQLSLDGNDLLPAGNGLIDANRVTILPVDLSSEKNDPCSPSSQAWSMARTIASSSSGSVQDSITAKQEAAGQDGNEVAEDAFSDGAGQLLVAQERMALINSVIDVWVTFSDAIEVIQGSKKQGSPDNQADQQSADIISEL